MASRARSIDPTRQRTPPLGELDRLVVAAASHSKTIDPESPADPPPVRSGGPPRLLPRRFAILEQLGKGGNGIVLKAFDQRHHRVVAVKIALPLALTSRIRREARALRHLDCPGIAKVFELFDYKSRLCLVTEFIDGRTLEELPALSLEQAVKLVTEASEILEFAHRNGFVHRDIKPSNLMLRASDERLFVIDFGLVKWQSAAPLTIEGLILGSPEFMSPEQAKGDSRSADARTDVYALGATLYRLLTNHSPFEGTSLVDLILKVISADPVHPRDHNPMIPMSLEAIVLTAMAKDPADRYPTAAAFADALRNWFTARSPAASAQDTCHPDNHGRNICD